MRLTWQRAAAFAALVFLGLFLLRFLTLGPHGNFPSEWAPDFDAPSRQAVSQNEKQLSRKNYASGKSLIGYGGGAAPVSPASPESQKYEKIGTLQQVTSDFAADRKRADELIRAHSGIVQQERAAGLDGRRFVELGIGVPPAKFDAFIEAARAIGKNVLVEIVKNDKTNEYLQLKAKRQTLEKARTALEELRVGGGSTEERVTVQNRLTEIEQQIQDLGVSLGEFDSENELCTVELTLREKAPIVKWSKSRRALVAFEHALSDYLMLGLGFFGLMLAAWLGTLVLRQALKMWASQRPGT